MKTIRLIAGVVLVVLGLVWFLQGIGVMGGSAMSGQTLWAVIGPILVILGAVFIATARRRVNR